MEITFNQGHNTSEDEKSLAPGELTLSQNAEYRVGDRKRIWKTPGRTVFGDMGSSAKAIGVALLQFDDKGGDQLVALSNGTLYGATPGASGSFAALDTGLSTIASRMGHAHYDDRQYIVNGADRMRVLDSAKAVRKAGMLSPTNKPSGTPSDASGSSDTDYASSTAVANSGFANFANSVDGSETTFASAPLAAVGSATATWGFAAEAIAAADQLYVKFALAGQQLFDHDTPSASGSNTGTGGITYDSGYDVTIKIEISEDSGATFATKLTDGRTHFTPQPRTFVYDINTATDQSEVQVKITLTYNTGANQATIQAYSVKIQNGSSTAVATTTLGLRYVYTEYDEGTGMESPPSPQSDAINLTAHNQVKITGPTASANTNTTHYIYYRTPEGGTVPNDLGQVGMTQVGSSKVFIDDFSVYAADDQPGPPLEMVGVEVNGATLYFDANQPPPLLNDITSYDGALVGIRGRGLYHSMFGRPESWPHINIIAKFPFKEHDTLVGMAVAQNILVLGANNLIVTVRGLPSINSGIFSDSKAEALPGAPGLVSQYAMTEYADDDDSGGESRVAWVSQFGIHETNGFRHRRLSSDIDWSNNVSLADLANAVLFWNPSTQQLVFSYSQGRYALIHMSDEHRKGDGRPKITWGHYGRVSDLTGGFVNNVYRVYSANPLFDKIYLERSGWVDEGNTVDATQVMPLKLRTGRVYSGDDYVFVRKGNLRHNASGSDTATVTWESGRDNPPRVQTAVRVLSLAYDAGTQFSVVQAGEWHQVTVEYSGRNDAAFADLRVDAEKMAQAGSVA